MKTKYIFLILLIIYFVTRFFNLLSLPIFNDEAFFLAMGKKIALDPLHNLFVNFTDGKEPLFFWLTAFTPNLFLARATAIILGLASLLALYKFSQKSLTTALIFIVSPFLLFYQRLAMQENLVVLFLISGLTFFKNPWILGTFFGLALLTKTTAIIFILGSLFLWFRNINHLAKVLIMLALVYSLILINPLSIVFHNSQYVGLISLPQIIINLKQAIKWFWEYQNLIFVLAIFAPLLIKDKSWAVKLWLAMLVPIFLESAVAKIFFPRYFIFSLIPLCILVGLAIQKHKILLLCLIPNLILSWQIIINVKTAPLPFIERWQHLESWPAGDGIKETAQFLANQKAQTVVVEEGIMVTQFGLPYYYPEANYVSNQSGEYYVFDKEQNIFPANLVLQYSYLKTGGKEKIRLFKKL